MFLEADLKISVLATFWVLTPLFIFFCLPKRKPNHQPALVHKYGWQERKGRHEQSSFSPQNASNSALGRLPFKPQMSHAVRGQPTHRLDLN